MKRYLHSLLFLSVTLSLNAKVLIITHSYNRPDFIEIQAKTFKAFLSDDYEFVVFNDASKEPMKQQIEQTCEHLGIRCIRVPQHLHASDGTAGARHVHGMQYSFNTLAYDHDGIVCLIDSDAFLIKPLSIESYLKDFDIAGELEGRGNNKIEIRYLSPILVFMNMRTLPNKRTLNFGGGTIHGFACDNGAQTYYYFKNNPSARRKDISLAHIGAFAESLNCQTCKNLSCKKCIETMVAHGFDEALISFIHECPNLNIEFFLNYHFLHYRGGCNWDGQSTEYHRIKTKALNNLINRSMNKMF